MPNTSSSRPTRTNGQALPPAAAAQWETFDPNPEWASQPFTLYISYLHKHVPEKMLFSVLRQTGIGMMRRKGKAIEITEHPGTDGRHAFKSAKIHFDFLFTRGDQRDGNIQILDHLLHGGDGAHIKVAITPKQTPEQVAARRKCTIEDLPEKIRDEGEPERFWQVKVWREGQRSASPPDAPAMKISLHGGVVGKKDAPPAAKKKSHKKQGTTDGDGFIQPKYRGGDSTVWKAKAGAAAQPTMGGAFAPLAERQSSRSVSPRAMTAVLKAKAGAFAPLAERQSSRSVSPRAMTASFLDSMTPAELLECNEAIEAKDPTPTNVEIADAAAEFIFESQLRCEGADNPAAWIMDHATGSMLLQDEMSAEEADALVPPHQVLNTSEILTAQ